jgi:methyl-accepting chemotaxis protein
MALIKTSKMKPVASRGSAPAKAKSLDSKRHVNILAGSAPRAVSGDRRQKAAERIAAATEQLAAGLTEAAAAAAELRRAMEQIAAGAEQANTASAKQLEAVKMIAGNLEAARNEAGSSERRTASVQTALAEAAGQITATARAIEDNTARQHVAVTVITELERQAGDISEIARTVSRISDQTNLLALNAAIEAARAGDDGRGFAVVADEVRALAETSEKSAQEVQGFTQTIQAEVLQIVRAVTQAPANAEAGAKSATAIIDAQEAMRLEMVQLARLAQEILSTAVEVARATTEMQRGAEQVAAAAAEQSAAAEEAQRAIGEQEQSLYQGQAASRSLANLADGLLAGASDAAAQQSAVRQIGVAAEQLSATMQEMSSAAAQITVAVDQINRGSQLQASATQQASSALASIENSIGVSQSNAAISNEQVRVMRAALARNREAVSALSAAVASALGETRASLERISGLEAVSRRIDKVVDRIALVGVQTTMLAVSGAVEAARAGAAGQGFAVVSGDIRGLAREASDSADQVKDTIRNMMDQLALARRNLEHIVESAAAEAEKSRVVFAALDRVSADLASLEEASKAILSGGDAISEAIARTAGDARQIASAAEQSNAASRQAALAASEQALSAEDLAAAIEEIASLADELNLPNG